MARYIDADKAIKHLRENCVAKYPLSFCNGNFASADEISKLPAADVAPKSEVAREIFEEIENNYADFLFDGCRNIIVLTEKDYAELKKKYTEEKS